MNMQASKKLILTSALLAFSAASFAVEAIQVKPVGPTPIAKAIKAPDAPKPDLQIINHGRVGGTDNQLMVQIKNNGADNTQGVLLQGLNFGAGGGGATAPVAPIKAGQTTWSKLTFNIPPSARGDRIKLMVDYNNQVAESNENNNTETFNWK